MSIPGTVGEHDIIKGDAHFLSSLKYRGQLYSIVYGQATPPTIGQKMAVLTYKYIDCRVSELSDNIYLYFSYQHILDIKNKGKELSTSPFSDVLLSNPEITVATSENIEEFKDTTLSLPDDTRQMMKSALETKSDLSDYELLKQFLIYADTILENDLRYGVSPFALMLPRRTLNGQMYLNHDVFPLMSGNVTLFYRDNIERVEFDSGYLIFIITIENDIPIEFFLNYSVLDVQVDQRMKHLKKVLRIYEADEIVMRLSDQRTYTVGMNINKNWKKSKERLLNVALTSYWIQEMEKMEAIQNAYGVKFELAHIEGHDEINELYYAVDNVFDGIMGNQNCHVTMPYPDINQRKFKIDEPWFFEEKDLSLPDMIIYNVVFRPCASMILPCIVEKRKAKDGTVKVDACCTYRVVED